ncbi:MAG: class I SAM-dependent methyltransferase [Thermoanaerobaculia bacterium]
MGGIDPLKTAVRDFRRRWFPDTLTRLVARELDGMGSVLDLGCGDDSRLQFVRGVGRRVGVDAFGPAIERARERGIHDEYILAALGELVLPDASFDAVIAIDVIEHFEKVESRRFVDRLERIARRKVVIFTPNGFLRQPPLDGNPWQEHKCGWEVSELRARGYRVEGVLGIKRLRGEGHVPLLRPQYLGEKFANVTRHLWTRRRPELDAALFAVKALD